MALINPSISKRERLRLKLSLDDLARKSGVNKATLHRIETGRMKRNADHVVKRLAAIFKLEPEALTATVADDAETDIETAFSFRSQLNVRISHETRNALTLVSKRYGVKALDILELAPLMFHVVAAETLKERSARLDALDVARNQISDLGRNFPHVSERMVNDWNGEELEELERRSIAACDVRGDLLDTGDDFVDTRPMDYDDGAENPFVSQVRERLAAVQGDGAEPDSFSHWSDGYGPSYEICRAEAIAYLAGAVEPAEAVIVGRVGLHEIPKELREPAMGEARAQWVEQRAAEIGKRNAEWLEKLGLGELGL